MSSDLLKLELKDLRLPGWLRLRGPLTGPAGLRVKYPPVAMDMGLSDLVLTRLARDKEKRWSLAFYDVVEVPPEILDSEFFRIRVKAAERFQAIVAGALQREAVKTDRISLVVPDHLARVALLSFEQLPRARREVVEMVRWKMKKAVPFKVEEAVVDYEVMPGEGGGYTVLAVLMPASTLQAHEAVFLQQGIHPGLIDLSTFSLTHLYRTVIDRDVPGGGDFMLLNATPTFFTVMIFRDGRPIFYRCKTFAFGGDGDAESHMRLIHRELQASLLYYQERLSGTQLCRAYTRVVGHDPQRVAALFGDAPTAVPPEPIDLRRVVDVAAGAEAPAPSGEVLQRIAPAVGAALGRDASRARPS